MKSRLFLLLLMLWPVAASAQLYALRDSVANGYNFWLYVPKNYKDCRAERLAALSDTTTVQRDTTRRRPMPIVLFLHGRSLSGTNLYTVRKYGTLDALTTGRKIDALIIAPQVKFDDWWRPHRLMNVVRWVSERYDVDSTRLYVLGMSLGGYGAIDFAAAYPDKTAAAMAFCGGSTRKDSELKKLNRVPLWIMHGTADRDVPVKEARRVRQAMEEDNSELPLLRYDEFEGAGHSVFARAFYLNETYDWLFKHSTADSVRVVDRTIKIPISRMSRENAYVGLKFGSVKLKVVDPQGEGVVPKDLPQPQAKYHIIKQGDTLGHLAIKYKTTVRKICALNKINENTILKLGKKLRVQ